HTRPDAKLVANSILAAVPPMRDALILVNPFETQSATRENLAPLRRMLGRLKSGGALVIFPGGEVASLHLKEHSVTDPPWKSTAARLAMHARCPVVPIFFPGANSVPFHVAGALHPLLRTLSLAREFEKLAGTTVHLRIGNPIPAATLSAYPDALSATAYLRSRVYFLANPSDLAPSAATSPLTTARTVTPAGPQRPPSGAGAAPPPAGPLCARGEVARVPAEPPAEPP